MNRFAKLVIGDRLDPERSDLSETAQAREPRSALTHIAALSASKSADGLINPKLVLAALLQSIGAGAGLIGLLVPVREAGALLPQILLAGPVDEARRSKRFWVTGAVGQALAALGIAAFAVFTSGALAGAGVIACVGVLAVARSLCSVSYKTVLGKTVDQTHRGRTTGLAASAGAATTLIGAGLLIFELAPRDGLLVGFVVAAAAFWALAALVMATLPETGAAADAGKPDLGAQMEAFAPALRRTWFQHFIATRALLSATAFAPPYILLSVDADTGLSIVGWLVLASAGAGLVSGYVWGRLADRSSKLTLMIASAGGGLALAGTAGAALAGGLTLPAAAVGLFALMLAYQGVRSGRSTYLVDKAEAEDRARYSALANTIMGVLLLLGGGVALLAEALGAAAALCVLAAACFAALFAASRLPEAQSS